MFIGDPVHNTGVDNEATARVSSFSIVAWRRLSVLSQPIICCLDG